VKANSTLTSPTTLYKLARAAASNMQLSESLNDPRTLVGMGRALQDLPLDRVNFVQYPGTTGGTGVYEGKVQPTTELADELFARIKADESFSLGAGSTGIGSESAPDTPTPATPAPATQTPAAQPPTGQTPAASTPAATGAPAATGTPSAPATTDTLDGLQGQSAAQQTCSKAFGS
jgi:hypothetical protein